MIDKPAPAPSALDRITRITTGSAHCPRQMRCVRTSPIGERRSINTSAARARQHASIAAATYASTVRRKDPY